MGRMPPRLRIHAPGAAAALLLRERLDGYGATAESEPDGGWTVSVRLDAAPRETVPASFAITRDWAEEFGLASVPVDLDGHTHLVRSSRPLAGVR